MKKFSIALVAALLCASLLTGCSSGMKDGTYKAEYKNADDHGWKDYVQVTVSGGKISEVDFDSINADGVLKSADPSYREAMEPVSGTYPEKFMKELEDQLISKQEVKKVDTLAGATLSTDSFKVLVTEALSKGAQKGNTATIIVE
ncbi:FMN-binding protein [Hydrogenoanaerobacterium sp.]|uniref:FMN-binding protein n=1 Tax=Hydrogenoanaerobacterium sp. TaxID=2953763 RepID=UPI00289A7257|nr:FMN-binding protein [Hydrogenoanaerobacterium sp.]